MTSDADVLTPPIVALIEAAMRGGAVALLLLLAVQAFHDAGRTWAGRAAGLLALSGAAYAAVSASFLAPILAPWMLPLRIVAFGGPCLFWIWSSALFDDDFEPGWRQPLIWFVLVVLGCTLIFTLSRAVNLAYSLLSLVLILLGLRQALSGRTADLIEPRRRFRLALTAVAAAYSAFIAIAELTAHVALVSPPVSAINALGLLVMAAFFAAARAAWLTPAVAAGPISRRPARPSPSDPPDAQEAELTASLHRAMVEEKAYREEGFNLAALARRLGVQEYRLRRLINQRLGHRNFTDFVNSYRLTEALTALADPAQATVPILTIALDAGFQSVGPFNRAFKAKTGVTPTEYRRQQQSEAQPAKA